MACWDISLLELDNGAPESSAVEGCRLELSEPSGLDFGEVEVGAGESTLPLQLSNSGVGDCLVVDLSLSESAEHFALGEHAVPRLAPGESLELSVHYAPVADALDQGTLWIHSNYERIPLWPVSLKGRSLAPALELRQESAFDPLEPSCESTQGWSMRNAGSLPLHVSEIVPHLGSPELSLVEPEQPFPWTLEPGESRSFAFSYQPVDEGEDHAWFDLHSDDPLTPIHRLPVSASAQPVEVREHFVSPMTVPVDFLFVVDQTGANPLRVQAMGDSLADFTEPLEEQRVDYRVSAAVSDDGCVVGDPLYWDASLSLEEQQAAFLANTCTDGPEFYCPYAGSNTERAFMLVEAALSDENLGPGGCNEGLLREQADLVIIAISDEPEQSVEDYSTYVARLRALKGPDAEVIIHGIGGPYPSGCEGMLAYTGIYEASVLTGGLLLSGCVDDFGPHLEQLAEASLPIPDLALSQVPLDGSLSVRINGEPLQSGFTYNPETGRLEFDELPEGGADIEVYYWVQPDCPE